MLSRLGDALGSWSPRRSAGDPLAAIRAAWIDLVGPDVARAAQPVALASDTLVVITTSSAWSHQLAFLEPRIARDIRDRAGVTIGRMRFRVGTIRAAVEPYRSSGLRGTRDRREVQFPPPGDAREALARFRAAVERSRAAHRARGGRFCSDCAAEISGCGPRCGPCRDWSAAELTARCQRLLFDAPWLGTQEILDMLPGLDAATFDGIRRKLLRAWWDEMALARKRAELPRPVAPNRGRLRKIASSFVLLETKLDPSRLEMDSAVRRNALGELYDFIRSVEDADRR
jgi:hypothetical protein